MQKKTSAHANKRLYVRNHAGIVQDVNGILHDRAKEMNLTGYGLAKAIRAVGGKTSEQSARTFLKGGGVRSENLGPLLKVLKLKIVPEK